MGKFAKLVREYVNGDIDIPTFTKKVDVESTEREVLLIFDLMGINRAVSKSGINEDKREETLSKLLEYSQQDDHDGIDSKLVEAEVVASQRIEGIHVSPGAFIEEF